MSDDNLRLIRIATTSDPIRTQRKSDVVVDVNSGRVVKNRWGPCPPVPEKLMSQDVVEFNKPRRYVTELVKPDLENKT